MTRWLITGCSTGIGREIATAALAAGHRVAASARSESAVADFLAGHPGRALALPLDVTDREQIDDAVQTTVAAFGGIDVLVNNAGHGYLSALEEADEGEVRRLFDTNFFGPVDMIRAVLPGMRERGDGHVINISSMTGLVANPPNVFYSCSKFAMEALTECLAKEVAPFGIRVTAIEPGAVRTDWAGRSMRETGSPMACYEQTVGRRREHIKAGAERMRGDPVKVAEAVVRVAGIPEPPLHLLLGDDVIDAFRRKLAELAESIDEWEPVTRDVNMAPEAV